MNSAATGPKRFQRFEDAADFLLREAGPALRVATPLGLGKPVSLLNCLYERAKKDPSGTLTLFTALSLNPPEPGDDLSRRFFGPFAKRQWGEDYPVLEYAKDARRNRLPPNVRVHEFYFQAGSAMRSSAMQRDYQSINYTHVVPRLLEENLNAMVQLIARDRQPGSRKLSLSCNPDLTRDLVDGYRERRQKRPLVIGVVHPDLPFLRGEAEVGEEFFDAILDDPRCGHRLFALPRSPVDETDHAIGFYASQMVHDDGTLQVGIGSLSDALVASLICRHEQNDLYRRLKAVSWEGREPSSLLALADDRFECGLYGLSEMVMDGFMHLRCAGILKRHVPDEESGAPTYLHGAFFLGSEDFYRWLRSLEGEDFEGLRMGRISRVNQLYGGDLNALREHRKRARFFNTCMQVTLLGGAASETLEDGKVVSGVGGQYNFVAMSHELPDSRSILMLRSTSDRGGKRQSSIVVSHGHLTIPRHLRDVVITEYGIANLRGRTDEETIQALLEISDSQFQGELMEAAKSSGKLDPRYEIPPWARNNTPERVRRLLAAGRDEEMFAPYPWGSDFTAEEERLASSLEKLKEMKMGGGKLALGRAWVRSLGVDARRFGAELKRMDLENPKGWRDQLTRRLLLATLSSHSAAQVS